MIYKKIIVTFYYFGKLRLNRRKGIFTLVGSAIDKFEVYAGQYEKIIEGYKRGEYNNVEIIKVEKIKIWEFWK